MVSPGKVAVAVVVAVVGLCICLQLSVPHMLLGFCVAVPGSPTPITEGCCGFKWGLTLLLESDVLG